MRYEQVGGEKPGDALEIIGIPETPEEIEKEGRKEFHRQEIRVAAEVKRLNELRAEAEQ